MHGLAFRVVQVDGSALVVVTLDLTQMHAQVVAKLAEFRFASILEAKLESCRKDERTLFTEFRKILLTFIISLLFIVAMSICDIYN